MPFQEQSIPHKKLLNDQALRTNNFESLPKLIYQDLHDLIVIILQFFQKTWLFFTIIITLFFSVVATFFISEAGYVYLYENPFAQSIEVYNKPGFHFNFPFSSVTRYKQVWIVDFGTGFTGKQMRDTKGPITLDFADNYTVKIPATFRYRLPDSKEKLERIHRDFTSNNMLVDALLIPISQDVMVTTAKQFFGEEFVQGGFNQFRMALEDQLQSGIYKTKQIAVEKEHILFGDDLSEMGNSLKVLKTVPIIDKNGEIERLEKKSVTYYGIEVIQITLGVPVSGNDLSQLLLDKKRLNREARKKAEELALILEDRKIQLANIQKDKQIKQARIELILVDQTLRTTEEKSKLAIEKAKLMVDITIAKEREDEKLAIDLTRVKAKKKEELVIAQENEKIRLVQVKSDEAVQLQNKIKELAIVKEEKKIQLANIEKLKAMELAEKNKELALVEQDKIIQLAKIEQQKATELAIKKMELAIVKEKENIEIAEEVKKLALVKANEKVSLAQKMEELVITKAEKEIQLAKKDEELAVAKQEQEIQQARFESSLHEAKAILAKGQAEADVLKAKYAARIPEIYRAEIQKEIVAIIYANLKDIDVQMPHNMINLGESGRNLQTNLDVLSSFATLNVMEELEQKAVEKKSVISD